MFASGYLDVLTNLSFQFLNFCLVIVVDFDVCNGDVDELQDEIESLSKAFR